MARETIKWYCEQHDCKERYPEFVNWVYKDELAEKLKSGQELLCKICGYGPKIDKPEVSSKGWLLGCCAFPYSQVRIPSGELQTGYKDGKGHGPKERFDPDDTYSVDEYRKKFKLDPEIYYYFHHPEKKRPSRLEPKPLPPEADVTSSDPIYPDELKSANKKIDDELEKAEELKKNGKLSPTKYLGVTGFLYKLRRRRNAGTITDDMLNDNLKKMWKAVGIDN
jgi:hypothetical protein